MTFRELTAKERSKALDKAATKAQDWLKKGFTPEQVAEGIVFKIGYMADAKDRVVLIGTPWTEREVTIDEIKIIPRRK